METNTANYRNAKRHVERELRFFIHLTVYILINVGLIAQPVASAA